MNMALEKLSPEQWSQLSRSAHKVSFGWDRDPEQDRINYALLVHNEKEPCCYATIIELDATSAYMQHGGAMPHIAKGVYTVKGYMMLINHLKKNYSCISTKILNTHSAMLKMALAAGLEVTGLDVVDGCDIFLILSWRKCQTGEEQ